MEVASATQGSGIPPCEVPDWKEYRARLIVFVRCFGGSVASAPEDVAHEIIERAVGRFGSYDGVHALTTWIYRIARNYCIDRNRVNDRRGELLQRHAPDLETNRRRSPAPDTLLERDETAAAVRGAVDRLSVPDRQITFLRYSEDLTMGEIARVMDMPVGTVKYRLHMILNHLKDDLAAEIGEDGQ